MKSGRQLAFEALLKILKDSSYSNLTVAAGLRSGELSGPERSLFTALVYGTVERKITLDYQLSRYLKQPIRKLNRRTYAALLLGAFQILFMDRVPSHAAINESVSLVKKNGAAYSSGLVNAVLHNVDRNGLQLPDESDSLPYLSVKYSCPEPLIQLWQKSYGEEATLGILEHALGAEPITIRVNTLKTDTDTLINAFAEEGVQAEPHPLVEDALVLNNLGSVEQDPLFLQGLYHVQDASSQLCCSRLDPQPGDRVYDVCAAPGGKSFTLAERMGDKGSVLSFDLYPKRVGLIQNGAERLGIQCIHADSGNAEEYDPERGLADRILCDVPCSGLGIIGRKPEIRYRSLTDIDNLPPVQYHILCVSAQYCRPGGRLVYSTCSLNPAENQDVVARFLDSHPEFALLSEETLLPGTSHCDGFFIAVLERTERVAQ